MRDVHAVRAWLQYVACPCPLEAHHCAVAAMPVSMQQLPRGAAAPLGGKPTAGLLAGLPRAQQLAVRQVGRLCPPRPTMPG